MKKQNSPSHIGQVLQGVFADLTQTRISGNSKEEILSAWHKAAGLRASRHSSPAHIKNGALLVDVDSTAWMYQLRLKEAGIINKINKLLESQKIKKIKFRAGDQPLAEKK